MKRKLDIIRERGKKPVRDAILRIDNEEQTKALGEVRDAVDNLYELINGKEEFDMNIMVDQLKMIHQTLDLKEQLADLTREVKNSKVETVTIKEFGELLKAVKENKPLPIKIDLTKLEKAIIQVEQRVQEQSTENTAPDDYKAFRRVIKVGSRLVFDDQPTPTRGGGGGSSATVATTVADGADVALGSTSDTVASSDTGTFSLIALVKRALQSLTTIAGGVGSTSKTLKTKTGSASATFTIVSAVASKKIKVYSLSLITASTTAVTVTFKDGAAGTVLATYPLQAITGTNFGITQNLAVPSSLFQTSAGTLLEMSFSAAQTVTYNLAYWDDDAS